MNLRNNALYQRSLDKPEPPKDRAIIGFVSGYPYETVIVWNPINKDWCYSRLDVDLYAGEWQDTSFMNEYADKVLEWREIGVINESTKE